MNNSGLDIILKNAKSISEHILSIGTDIHYILDLGVPIKDHNSKDVIMNIPKETRENLISGGLAVAAEVIIYTKFNNILPDDAILLGISNIAVIGITTILDIIHEGKISFIYDNIDKFKDLIFAGMYIHAMNLCMYSVLLRQSRKAILSESDDAPELLILEQALYLFEEEIKLLSIEKVEYINNIREHMWESTVSAVDAIDEQEREEFPDNVCVLHPGSASVN